MLSTVQTCSVVGNERKIKKIVIAQVQVTRIIQENVKHKIVLTYNF